MSLWEAEMVHAVAIVGYDAQLYGMCAITFFFLINYRTNKILFFVCLG
jgi:hypothetical protein